MVADSPLEPVKGIGGKVQTQAAAYPHFVIRSLVGIKGTSMSAVLDFIIVDWVTKNQEELTSYGISVETWRRQRSSQHERRPLGVLSTKKEDPSGSPGSISGTT